MEKSSTSGRYNMDNLNDRKEVEEEEGEEEEEKVEEEKGEEEGCE